MAGNNYIKQMSFDLDTKQVEKYLGSASLGYNKLRKVLNENGFEHRQGSVYVSKNKLSENDVRIAIKNCVEKELWLGEAVNKIDVANISKKQFSLKNLVEDAFLSELENGRELETYSQRRAKELFGNVPERRERSLNCNNFEKEK